MNRLKRKLALAAILGSFAGGAVVTAPSRAEADIFGSATKAAKDAGAWLWGALGWFGQAQIEPVELAWNALAGLVWPQAASCLARVKSIPSRTPENPPLSTFTMIFASDTQINWWPDDSTDPPNGGAGAFDLTKCSDDDCKLLSSVKANENEIKAWNNVTNIAAVTNVNAASSWPNSLGGRKITKPVGVVINGDLTNFGFPWQWKEFDKLFNPGSMQLPVYLGLGNHDYSNNVKDCGSTFWPFTGAGLVRSLRYGASACARFSVDYIRSMMWCGTVSGFPAKRIRSFDVESLAYSWEIGNYHFVQLHYRPDYAGKGDRRVGIRRSVERDGTGWLANDLALAGTKKIVINLHDPSAVVEDPGFMNAIRNSGKQGQVVAVFAGHLHERWGWLDGSACSGGEWDVRSRPTADPDPNPDPDPNAGDVNKARKPGCRLPGTQIPIFVSGSSDQRKFLLAEFSANRMRVAVVDSTAGVPTFQDPSPNPDGCCKGPAPKNTTLNPPPPLGIESYGNMHFFPIPQGDPTAISGLLIGGSRENVLWRSCKGKPGRFRKDHKGCRNIHTRYRVHF